MLKFTHVFAYPHVFIYSHFHISHILILSHITLSYLQIFTFPYFHTSSHFHIFAFPYITQFSILSHSHILSQRSRFASKWHGNLTFQSYVSRSSVVSAQIAVVGIQEFKCRVCFVCFAICRPRSELEADHTDQQSRRLDTGMGVFDKGCERKQMKRAVVLRW